jgi:putative peptide zinc metalloprotease protein
VHVANREDGRFRASGRLDYVAINHDRVAPSNYAHAEATCTDCQTLAVAAQIALYERGANNVSPQNFAVAMNVRCRRCVTIALAYQYLIPVDDIDNAPEDAKRLVKEFDREFNEIEKIRSLQETSPSDVEARINSVIVRFHEYAQYLSVFRDEDRRDQNGTPTAVPTEPVAPTAEPTTTPESTGTPATPTGTATAAP